MLGSETQTYFSDKTFRWIRPFFEALEGSGRRLLTIPQEEELTPDHVMDNTLQRDTELKAFLVYFAFSYLRDRESDNGKAYQRFKDLVRNYLLPLKDKRVLNDEEMEILLGEKETSFYFGKDTPRKLDESNARPVLFKLMNHFKNNALDLAAYGDTIKEGLQMLKEVYYKGQPIKRAVFENTQFWPEGLKSSVPTERDLINILYGDDAKFPGEENILGAMLVAKQLGMSDIEIDNVLAKIDNKFGGIETKQGINGFKIVDASYSANPDSIISHLEYFKEQPGKKIIVMPCLIELGKASKEVHKRIGKKIAETCDLAIITTKDGFKEIIEGVLLRQGCGGREIKKDNILFLENPKEIFEKIMNFTKAGDVILLESRVPKELIKLLIK